MSLFNKPYLKTGFLLALIVPGIFVFSQPIASIADWISRFFTSFLYIFTIWTVNFSLIDFKNTGSDKMIYGIPRLYIMIAFSFLFALAFLLLIGFTLDSSRRLISQIQREKVYSFRSWFFLCLRISLFNAVILLIKYLFDSNKEKQKIQTENEQLKTESLRAQHEALKQRVNPHFLFNSLNTMKSLVKSDPRLSLAFIDELSSVYRYMLHHQEEILVLVKDEIDFLTSYLYLLRIRFGQSLVTDIEVPEACMKFRMPPNTLQLLAENAVKHNIFSSKRPLRISIYESEGRLIIENNLQLKIKTQTSSGLGLTSIRSRYLLSAGKDIEIVRDDRCFKVLLPLIKSS